MRCFRVYCDAANNMGDSLLMVGRKMGRTSDCVAPRGPAWPAQAFRMKPQAIAETLGAQILITEQSNEAGPGRGISSIPMSGVDGRTEGEVGERSECLMPIRSTAPYAKSGKSACALYALPCRLFHIPRQ